MSDIPRKDRISSVQRPLKNKQEGQSCSPWCTIHLTGELSWCLDSFDYEATFLKVRIPRTVLKTAGLSDHIAVLPKPFEKERSMFKEPSF